MAGFTAGFDTIAKLDEIVMNLKSIDDRYESNRLKPTSYLNKKLKIFHLLINIKKNIDNITPRMVNFRQDIFDHYSTLKDITLTKNSKRTIDFIHKLWELLQPYNYSNYNDPITNQFDINNIGDDEDIPDEDSVNSQGSEIGTYHPPEDFFGDYHNPGAGKLTSKKLKHNWKGLRKQTKKQKNKSKKQTKNPKGGSKRYTKKQTKI